MKKLSKMLAVPVAFVVAFMLFGTPAAPGATVLPDNVGDAACADTNGLCYGGYGPSSCCPGYAYDRHTGTCYYCPDGVTGTGYGCRDLGVEQTMCDVAAILGLAATALNTAGTLALMTGVGAGLGIGLFAVSVPLTAMATGGTLACLTL